MGHDKNQYILVQGYSISTQWYINVHVRLSVRHKIHAIKMVGRSVDKKDEIRAYIKARSKLGCSLKKLMTEISTTFGPSCVSYDTVRRWKKKFESGVESIKNALKSGRPKSASYKEIVSKIKEIIEGDARFTVRDIARKVGISLSTVHLILKKHLKDRKISAR